MLLRQFRFYRSNSFENSFQVPFHIIQIIDMLFEILASSLKTGRRQRITV